MTPAHTLHATTRTCSIALTCAIAHNVICPYRTIVTVSMRKVSLRACAKSQCECAGAYLNFGASVPKSSNTLKHARSENLLSQRSFEYARSATLLSQRSFEYACCEAWSALAARPGEYSKPRPHSKLRCDYCRRFDPFEWVEASIHSQFFFSPPKQIDGLS